MIPRDAAAVLSELAAEYPVIAITGPRQSGKTTLARDVFSNLPYVSLEVPDVRELAEDDPRGFLARYETGAVFDEVQRTPRLFSYLQGMVDADPTPGRFVLTGSQQFGLLSGITQSLAGRIALVHLLPFTFHELYASPESRPPLNDLLYTGFYPPIHDRGLDPGRWFGNYVQTYVERDVRQMVNVRDLRTFQRFLRLCAGRNGQLLNLSNLATESGITHNTAKAWISILEASYILFLLPPHHENFNKRVIKAPKLYFYDVGLVCWLLSIQSAEQLDTHSMRGAIFEAYVVGELKKAKLNQGLPDRLNFWRDRSGHEVDVLIDHGDRLQPIEIKSGQTLSRAQFEGLQRWLDLAGSSGDSPLLVYGGNEAVANSGIEVYPWFDRGWLSLTGS